MWDKENRLLGLQVPGCKERERNVHTTKFNLYHG